MATLQDTPPSAPPQWGGRTTALGTAALLWVVSMGLIWTGSLGWGSASLWAAALGGLMAAFRFSKASPPSRLIEKQALAHPRLTWGIALGIIALGAFLRVYRWDDIPVGIWSDELLGAANGVRLLESPQPPFGTLSLVPEWPQWVQTFNLYSYFAAAMLWLFGVGHGGVKALSIVPGILCLPALYWLLKGLGGHRAAMFGTLTLALSRWGLTQSRFEWDATLHIALGLLSLGALAHGLKKTSPWLMALSGTLLGLAQFTYLASRLTAAGALAGLGLALLLGLPRGRRAQLPGLIAFAMAFALSASPVAYTTIHDEERAKSRIEQLKLSEGGLFEDLETIKANTVVYLRALAVEGPTNARQNIPKAPLLPAPIPELALLGSLLCLHPRYRAMGLVLWGVGGASMMAGILSSSRMGANAHRIGMVLPVLCAWAGLAASVGIHRLEALIPEGHRRALGPALWALGGVALFGIGLRGPLEYFGPFATSRAHWRAVGSGPQLHLAKALQSEVGGSTIWIDNALKDRTFDLLLYTEPTEAGGGLEDPQFQGVPISPRRLLPEAPPGQSVILALHPAHISALDAQLGGLPVDLPLGPFGTPLYGLYHVSPEELADIRGRLLEGARGQEGEIVLLPGDLQGPGLIRLERSEPGGPFVGAEIERQSLFRGLPNLPQPAAPKPMEWHGHLYINHEGAHRFTHQGSGPGRIYIDNRRVPWDKDIHLTRGVHAFRLMAPGGRYNRSTLLWRHPSQPEAKVMPLSLFRPKPPRGFKLFNLPTPPP